ncbi:hypothetical protein SAY86_010483 [Trapa natans]|uniref:BRX domain-containing protein n=1 Tax=Trapa natans TaxID=22666 RepID=A0AAN7R3B6_TRANT|nr:hypothetical protein SAY86_010483 [Trapa natans]
MFTCIACTKQTEEAAGEGEDTAARGGGISSSTTASKETVKSLTTQIKDMALKISGTYRPWKPCAGSSTYKSGQSPYPDLDTISEGVPHPFGVASSRSTPAWDFIGGIHGYPNRADPRFGVPFNGDRTPRGVSFSEQSCDVALEDDDDEPKEWVAQVEPGVHITFASLRQGGNDLKRIRFSRDIFNKWQAQRWWAENYDRIMELYNVQRFGRQALRTPSRSDDGRDSDYTGVAEIPMGPSAIREWALRSHYRPSGGPYSSSSSASRMTTDSLDGASASHSNVSEVEAEWVEQDEPGVYITIRQSVDGTRELRRVRFSREIFGEVRAKMWWEVNRERIQAQYL